MLDELMTSTNNELMTSTKSFYVVPVGDWFPVGAKVSGC
jgi:hypothetical protein